MLYLKSRIVKQKSQIFVEKKACKIKNGMYNESERCNRFHQSFTILFLIVFVQTFS